MAFHIRKDDIVEIICGDHRGQRGKVLRIDRIRGLVVVEGVNLVYRHIRPSRKNPQGGRLQKEAPLHMSNVLPYDQKAGKGSRVHFETAQDSRGRITAKKRICRASGSSLNEVTRAERK